MRELETPLRCEGRNVGVEVEIVEQCDDESGKLDLAEPSAFVRRSEVEKFWERAFAIMSIRDR